MGTSEPLMLGCTVLSVLFCSPCLALARIIDSDCGNYLHFGQVNKWIYTRMHARTHTHTHTDLFNGLFPGRPGWAGTRKIKPIWILLNQETVSGSGIRWATCKSAPRSRQITTPAPHHSVFLQSGCPSCRPTNNVKALKAKGHKSVYYYYFLKPTSTKPQAGKLG